MMKRRSFLSRLWLLLVLLLSGALRAQDEPAGRVGADIVDIYDQAVAHLNTVCDDYRRIKAIQLARQRDLPFDEAFENISSVMPILRPIKKDLLRKAIRNPKDIGIHKAEVEVVKKEVEMMIDLVAKLLKEIEVIQAEQIGRASCRERV